MTIKNIKFGVIKGNIQQEAVALSQFLPGSLQIEIYENEMGVKFLVI